MNQYNLRIDPDLRDLLPPLADAEREQLRANLIADGLALVPLVVWQRDGERVIVEGHHRFELCEELGLPYTFTVRAWASKADVIAWMLDHQAGRRNLSQKRLRYIRGKAYEAAKKEREKNLVPGARRQETSKNPTFSSMGQNDPSRTDPPPATHPGPAPEANRTSEEIAQRVGVSEATIRRDAEFAVSLDSLSGFVRAAILDGGNRHGKGTQVGEMIGAEKGPTPAASMW